MKRLAIFGYGSLVSRASIAETLGRQTAEPVAARLAGWRRRWSLVRVNAEVEKRFEREDGRPFVHCLGLNIERTPGLPEPDWPNGALIELSATELERLDRREVRYDRVDVTRDVRPAEALGDFEAVFAFRAKPAHFAPEAPPDSIIIASYVEACEAAYAELGADELERFRRTTGPFPAPVVPARLVADTIPPGNPRAW